MTAIAQRAVTFSADTRIEVSAVAAEPHEGRRPVLELRLARRDAVTGEWCPTAAGFRLPLHAAADVRSAIEQIAARACEHAACGALHGMSSRRVSEVDG